MFKKHTKGRGFLQMPHGATLFQIEFDLSAYRLMALLLADIGCPMVTEESESSLMQRSSCLTAILAQSRICYSGTKIKDFIIVGNGELLFDNNVDKNKSQIVMRGMDLQY